MIFAHPVLANLVGEVTQMLTNLVGVAAESWQRHDTLKYFVVAAVAFLIAIVSNAREWNVFITATFSIAGLGCIIAAGFMFLLGDWARHTGSVSPQMVAREVRASHGEKISPAQIGEPCHTAYDCADSGNVRCVQMAHDTATKCWAKCGDLHACPGKLKCYKVSGTHVCGP